MSKKSKRIEEGESLFCPMCMVILFKVLKGKITVDDARMLMSSHEDEIRSTFMNNGCELFYANGKFKNISK